MHNSPLCRPLFLLILSIYNESKTPGLPGSYFKVSLPINPSAWELYPCTPLIWCKVSFFLKTISVLLHYYTIHQLLLHISYGKYNKVGLQGPTPFFLLGLLLFKLNPQVQMLSLEKFWLKLRRQWGEFIYLFGLYSALVLSGSEHFTGL